MSFLKVKPTEIELKRLKKRREFFIKGKSLLEIKREQLFNSLNKISDEYFKMRKEIRSRILQEYEMLEYAYETIGKLKLDTIAKLEQNLYNPTIDITFIKKMGMIQADIKLDLGAIKLPSYSFFDTTVHLDRVIKHMREILGELVKLAEMDHKLYHIAQEYITIQRRINGLEDIIIPKLERDIRAIEEILEDNEREEFIRMKKIKEQFERKQNKPI